MPDGSQVLHRSSHVDSHLFSIAAASLRMDKHQQARSPPPPGIFAPISPPSRSVAAVRPPGLAAGSQDTSSASLAFHSSPPTAPARQAALVAPTPMQPYPRLTSPQPSGEAATAGGSSSGARSPSPTKRSFNFPMGDPSERWNSIGQVSGNANRGPTIASQRKPSLHSSLSIAAAEPFLGYNELFSPNGTSSFAPSESQKSANTASLSTSDPMNVAFRSGSSVDSRGGFALSSSQEQDLVSHRFGLSSGHYAAGGREDLPSQLGGNPRSVGHDDFNSRSPFGPGPGQGMLGLPNPGNLSPRSMMQLQHQHMQMQSQLHHHHHQQQQQQSSHQPLFGPPPPQQQQLGLPGGVGNSAGVAGSGGNAEEITTVFIVGFPDDMTEREFANMFLFSKGFEASTLKVPPGLGAVGPNGRLSDGAGPLSAGPGGPYQAVNMPGSGVYDLGGAAGSSWEEQNLPLGLGRPGPGDAFSSLNTMPGMPGANNMSAAAAAGKIKQIIGFAKFRTRAEALEARDALNGRRVDAEKGCVLKTEMAKKNLHTKQRPVLSAPGFPEGASGSMPPPTGAGSAASSAGPSGASAGQPPLPPYALGGPFDSRSGRSINDPSGHAGPFGPLSRGSGSFEPFGGPTSTTQNDLLSPHEVFGGPDFFGQGGLAALRSSIGASAGVEQQERATGHFQQPQQQSATGVDKWGGSLGPIDFYRPEAGATPMPASSRGLQGGNGQSLNAPTGPRSDWPAVGSPPPGLYGPVAGATAASAAQRPGFQRQSSRGNEPPMAPGYAVAPGSGKQLEEGLKAESNRFSPTSSSTGPEAAATSSSTTTTSGDAQPPSLATRFGSIKIGLPADDNDVKPPQQDSSPDLPSPTGGRNVVGDNHPPVNTLFVGNLPSNASSAVLSQIEDQLRAVFGSCRGFRQFSFRLKSNGPMCFVEFEDVHTASKAMSELNGHSLGGAIKNGGIRLSFSKNPLFRMNSNSSMGTALNGVPVGSGSTSSTEGGSIPSLSLGSASESIAAAARR